MAGGDRARGRGRGRRRRRWRAERRPGPATPRGARSPAAAPPARPGLRVRSRRPPGRLAPPAAARLPSRRGPGRPARGLQKSPRPLPRGSPARPLPWVFIKLPGPGAGPGASAAPARRGSRSKQQQMRRARDLTMPVGSLGPGVPGGAAGRLGRCPPPSAPVHPVLAGAERMEWAAGPEETASSHPPLSSRRPRAAAQTLQRVKFPVPRGAGDTQTARGRRPGAWRGRTLAGRGHFGPGGGGGERRPAPGRPPAFRGLTFVRARAASAARPPTRVFCNQSVRLIKGGATAS